MSLTVVGLHPVTGQEIFRLREASVLRLEDQIAVLGVNAAGRRVEIACDPRHVIVLEIEDMPAEEEDET